MKMVISTAFVLEKEESEIPPIVSIIILRIAPKIANDTIPITDRIALARVWCNLMLTIKGGLDNVDKNFCDDPWDREKLNKFLKILVQYAGRILREG
ncbi:MAG: hypothetical protein QXN08_08895 [Nitrososphaerales archaeon]|jgi:hypothetical protein